MLVIAAAVLCVGVGVAQDPAAAPDPAFAAWLAELRADAIERGISAAIVDEALASVEPLPVVLERDRAQAERVLSIDQYLTRRVTQKTVATARAMAARHHELLEQVTRAYGVPARVIVAVWGLESNFGQFTGVRPTISSLATLAYDPRRATYFRGELFNALRILERRDIDLASMKGSWAGAMGQPQFMPSSYLSYAVDFDKDGRRDIWSSPTDVFASVANYLKAHGWMPSWIWGREVRVPAAASKKIAEAVGPRTGGCDTSGRATELLPLARWQELGVRLAGNRPLPKAEVDASLVRTGSRFFLVYRNYDAILAYNCAHSYALSVGLLADRIGG